MEKGWYKKPDHFRMWVHILLKASHKENDFWFDGKTITVKPGQFVTGRKALAIEIGISESKIERILNFFEKSEHQIKQQKTNKNRLISVINWNQYQKFEQQIEQQLNNKRTTTEQQVNTINNVNNKNNKNNKNKRGIFKPPTVDKGNSKYNSQPAQAEPTETKEQKIKTLKRFISDYKKMGADDPSHGQHFKYNMFVKDLKDLEEEK